MALAVSVCIKKFGKFNDSVHFHATQKYSFLEYMVMCPVKSLCGRNICQEIE
jgi:hypothetical protein